LVVHHLVEVEPRIDAASTMQIELIGIGAMKSGASGGR
jgi:hypothetical protein